MDWIQSVFSFSSLLLCPLFFSLSNHGRCCRSTVGRRDPCTPARVPLGAHAAGSCHPLIAGAPLPLQAIMLHESSSATAPGRNVASPLAVAPGRNGAPPLHSCRSRRGTVAPAAEHLGWREGGAGWPVRARHDGADGPLRRTGSPAGLGREAASPPHCPARERESERKEVKNMNGMVRLGRVCWSFDKA